MKKRKGSIMVMVVCIFVVITIITGMLCTYFMVNVTQATKQRESIQAYYLVEAGLELGVSALMEPDIDASGNEYYPLLEYYASNLTLTPTPQLVDLGTNKKVTLTVEVVDKEGNRLTGGGPYPDIWVQVTAVGAHTNSSGTTERAGIIRIDTANPASIVRELEIP